MTKNRRQAALKEIQNLAKALNLVGKVKCCILP